MELRNIHFAPPADEPQPAAPTPTPESVAAALPERMKLRKVSLSPLEEYARRDGNVRPISDALAACILSFKGRAEVNAKGVKIDRKTFGVEKVFWHPDSIICSDLGSRERKWIYFINRNKPDRIHLFDDQGRYIETLPEKTMPAALDLEAQAKSIADDKRAIARNARHLQNLHGTETWDKVEEMRRNREATTRYVQTLDAPASAPRQPAAEPVAGGTAERLVRADRQIDQAIERHQSAAEFGRALGTQRGSSRPVAAPVAAEDWSTLPANSLRNTTPATTPTEIESW
jgi:hypothetical protein